MATDERRDTTGPTDDNTPAVQVTKLDEEIDVRIELPELKQEGAMFQVVKAAYRDGVLEVVMQESSPPATLAASDDMEPLPIFPE